MIFNTLTAIRATRCTKYTMAGISHSEATITFLSPGDYVVTAISYNRLAVGKGEVMVYSSTVGSYEAESGSSSSNGYKWYVHVTASGQTVTLRGTNNAYGMMAIYVFGKNSNVTIYG